MSMSTSVYGIKPADEKFMQMKEVYDACVKAKVAVPKEVDEFFDYETPDEKGVQVPLDGIVEEYCVEGSAGYDVDITKLPSDVKIIRLLNSW